MGSMTGVSGVLSAAHTDDEGKMHGHTWVIKAWWKYNNQDALQLKSLLKIALENLDHTILPDNLRSGEALAIWLGHRLGCDEVFVEREAEGIFACWRR